VASASYGVNPQDHGEPGPKSDKRDAYGLAEKLRVGNLDKPVFKSPRQFTVRRQRVLDQRRPLLRDSF
jgi:hypothetical protein